MCVCLGFCVDTRLPGEQGAKRGPSGGLLGAHGRDQEQGGETLAKRMMVLLVVTSWALVLSTCFLHVLCWVGFGRNWREGLDGHDKHTSDNGYRCPPLIRTNNTEMADRLQTAVSSFF